MSEASEEEYTKFDIESNASETSRVEYALKDLSEVVGSQQPDEDRKWPKTVALFGGFFSLGLVIGILGPTIPDLLYQVDASYDQLSYIFLSRGFGYMIGSIISGVLFEILNAFGLLGTFLVACSLGALCVPATKNLATVIIAFIFCGTAMGGLDTGGNVLCLRIWGEKSPPYMQALHFMFAMGACAAPLIAKPFISVFSESLDSGNTSSTTEMFISTDVIQSLGLHLRNIEDPPIDELSATVITPNFIDIRRTPCPENITCYFTSENDTKPNTTDVIDKYTTSMVSDLQTLTSNRHPIATTNYSGSTFTTIFNDNGPDFGDVEILGNLYIAYGIIAAVTFLTSLAFYYFCFTSQFYCKLRCTKSVQHKPLAAADAMNEPNDKWFRIHMLSILFIFYFLYIGGEVAFGSYIYSYAINCNLKFSKDSASLLNSVFWGTFALFRGVAIVLAYVFTPLQMLMADVIVCMGASVVLVLFANTSYIGIWSGTAVLGAAMASLFPTGLSWLERYIQVTGNDAAILVVGASFGEMVIPFVIGQFFPDNNDESSRNEDINSLMYLVLVIACLTFILFLIAFKLASRKGERYSKKDAPREIPMTSL